MSKPMSYYEEKYIYAHEAKETKKCPMGWDQSCYGCMHCFPGLMSSRMIIKEKMYVWNVNGSFKREMGLLQRQSNFRHNGEYNIEVII